jgi:tyrosinase
LNAPRGPANLLAAEGKSRRVFLNIENITSTGRTASYAVYLNPQSEANPHEDKSRLAGILPMFGVPEASRPDSEHGGSGLTYSLDVTDLVGQLQAKGQWDPAHLNVTFAPRAQSTEGATPTASARPKAEIKVGRVSVYYQ